nr:hypothetical protein [Tanacetum cinerariifolium]
MDAMTMKMDAQYKDFQSRSKQSNLDNDDIPILKIYEAEVKSCSSTSTSTQNIAFVSSSNTNSTNEPVSTAASVSTVSAKIPVSALPNVDSLSNIDDLEQIDLKWSPKDARRNGAAEPQRRNVPVKTSISNALVFQYDGVASYDWSFQANEEPTTMLLWPSLLQVLLLTMRNLSELLASQTNDKTGLGYNSQVFTRVMFDCDDYLSSGSDESLPASPIYYRYQSGNRYHVVPPPYTGTFMPPKPDLVFNNAPNDVETFHTTFNVNLSLTNPDNDLSHTHRPSAPIIKDWVSDLEDESETKIPQIVPSFIEPTEQAKSPRPSVQHSKLVPITVVRLVTTAIPKINVTRPRQAKTIVTKTNSPPRRHINRSPSPKASNFPPKVTAVKALMVTAAKGNPQHALTDKGVIDSGCSRHITGNMSYLSDFEELNGGYVAFGGNPKG